MAEVRGSRENLIKDLQEMADGYRCMGKPEEHAQKFEEAAELLAQGSSAVKPRHVTYVVTEDG